MNGIYWHEKIPRLFEMEEIKTDYFKINSIADITDDKNGSVPCNFGDATIENPIYGIDKFTGELTEPYLPNSIDMMAVGNLPNELPRDASRYFGEQIIKFLLDDLLNGGSKLLQHATIVKEGKLTETYDYMREYAEEEVMDIK